MTSGCKDNVQIVEEIEERLSEDAVTELLEVIHILLPDVETDKHES